MGFSLELRALPITCERLALVRDGKEVRISISSWHVLPELGFSYVLLNLAAALAMVRFI